VAAAVARAEDAPRHAVPLGEIRDGGPPPDGIPPIEDPKFISADDAAGWLDDDALGIALSRGGSHRFYPYPVLVWHEIVNDEVDGRRVLVTYCPLCATGIVFDPVVGGERVTFGTSGKLWNSNLLMYDRKTRSLWSQVLGKALVGPETGSTLRVLPSDVVPFGKWRAARPDGEVLSRETGARRDYDRDPYGDYYTRPGLFFPLTNVDRRLPEKTFVVGVRVGDAQRAYPVAAVRQAGEISESFAGTRLVVRYVDERGAVRVFEKQADGGALERIPAVPAFWFSWSSAYPDTTVYKRDP